MSFNARRDAAAGDRFKRNGLDQRQLSFLRRVDDRSCQRMLAILFDGRRQSQQLVVGDVADRMDGDQLRPALGERAGLVDHQRVDLFELFERGCIFHEHAFARPAADADHDRHRRGQAQRTGTGDDQHRHRADERIRQPRIGRSPHAPRDERQHRRRDHERHEPRGHRVGHALDRRAAALGIGHHLDDVGERRVAADLFGVHQERTGLVHRAGDHRVAERASRPASARR